MHSEESPKAVATNHSQDFLDETIRVWQKYSDRQLTHDDARQIIDGMTGFFKILREMDERDKLRKSH